MTHQCPFCKQEMRKPIPREVTYRINELLETKRLPLEEAQKIAWLEYMETNNEE